MIRVIILSALFFLSACTSGSKKSVIESPLVFPDGRYFQYVEVKVSVKNYKNDFDFNCIVQKNPNSFLFVGYNSFGISLFKIKEVNGKVEMESSIKQINEKKEFFLEVFKMVKTLLNTRKDDPKLQNPSFDVNFQKVKSTVVFKKTDHQGVPMEIKIETPGLYEIEIETSKYELI